MDDDFAFETDREDRASSDPELVVDVGGFEGPLDLLLDLARKQKVDLHEISILALAEQYLAFIERVRKVRLELAADYLVMAAWLAYLKSRLLLPEPPKAEGPSAEELASALALRLRRLEAIRAAAKLLAEMPQLNREIFARGAPEHLADRPVPTFTATLHDILSSYGRQRQKQVRSQVTFQRRPVLTLAEAREALERLIGRTGDWIELDRHLLAFLGPPEMRASILASSLSAALELVREGRAAIRQDEAFAPLLLRRAEAQLRLIAS